jgi:hypothetical protein
MDEKCRHLILPHFPRREACHEMHALSGGGGRGAADVVLAIKADCSGAHFSFTFQISIA